ncbi:fumarylacetoacetate hydrolase family protein [Pseudomaricurvus sp. HS19]|uniref:fumarylacetoacetate hydrolase family protein n=1 Tax=Pseudomaricurvus sp. HS19 TaxID=2692626 RepID=UPI00136D4A58|nr:fumarylacetoacetate hydrolase family protein [Pseudomaricurvus sp. HS19]MYM64135.1 fumarylacetoacetate hydrolase family protein [Pseudomaricurvus sp. HS19]
MPYQHLLRNPAGELQPAPWAPGKVVCIGRNYADHARELNNPVPAEPLLFLKPATAMVSLRQPLRLPQGMGSVHVETEMALLIGRPLQSGDAEEALLAGIAGVGIGFDLTLRDLQNRLKEAGHPWEKAKAFDGACPLSEFVDCSGLDWGNVELELQRNGQLQQRGNSSQMLTPVPALLRHIVEFFSLQPGDVVMTGTPAGVGPLASGDQLAARLADRLQVSTTVL